MKSVFIMVTLFAFFGLSSCEKENVLPNNQIEAEGAYQWAAYQVSNPSMVVTPTMFAEAVWLPGGSWGQHGNVLPYNQGKAIANSRTGSQWVYLVRPFIDITSTDATREHLVSRGWEPVTLGYFSALLNEHTSLIGTTYNQILCLDTMLVNDTGKGVYVITQTNPHVGGIPMQSLIADGSYAWTKEILIPCFKK